MTAAADLVSPLARRWGLDVAASGALAALLAILDADPTAPTTARRPAEALEAHLADSLVALELEPVRATRTMADLGAGAGFPGLVLACALPDARFRLVESTGRKCAFIARAAEAAGLANVEVVHARAEEWAAGRDAHDVVTARALGALPVILEYAAPLLRERGLLVAWKGRRDPAEDAAGGRTAAQLGLELVEVRHVQPFPAARDRHLHLYRKVAPTPQRFPRRPGMARKRPLGGV